MDMVHTSFMRSLLSIRPVGDVRFGITRSTLIYDARNMLADQAINGGFDRTLWFDSDMTFAPDIMERLSKRLDEGNDVASALYFTRRLPYSPVIFKDCKVFEKDGTQGSAIVWYDDYPKDSVIEIEACGFGGVMISTDLLKRMKERFGSLFSHLYALGEDLSFCIRANAISAKMICDTSVKMGHIGYHTITEDNYDATAKS